MSKKPTREIVSPRGLTSRRSYDRSVLIGRDSKRLLVSTEYIEKGIGDCRVTSLISSVLRILGETVTKRHVIVFVINWGDSKPKGWTLLLYLESKVSTMFVFYSPTYSICTSVRSSFFVLKKITIISNGLYIRRTTTPSRSNTRLPHLEKG